MPLKVRFYHSYVRIIAQCSSRFRLISGGLTKSDKKGNHTAEMQDI